MTVDTYLIERIYDSLTPEDREALRNYPANHERLFSIKSPPSTLTLTYQLVGTVFDTTAKPVPVTGWKRTELGDMIYSHMIKRITEETAW